MEGLSVFGKPWDSACYYYEAGAEELVHIDIAAGLKEKNDYV